MFYIFNCLCFLKLNILKTEVPQNVIVSFPKMIVFLLCVFLKCNKYAHEVFLFLTRMGTSTLFCPKVIIPLYQSIQISTFRMCNLQTLSLFCFILA